MVTAPFAARVLSRTIQRVESTSVIPGLIPSMVVALLLFSAWTAHAMGAPELLGGFTAGLALSRYFFLPFAAALGADAGFAHRVEEQMRPLVHLFAPIFFVMVGLSLNLREVDWSSSYVWLLSGSLLVAATVGKLAAGLLMRNLAPGVRWAVGLSMVPRGEVGLIFAELGRTSGIFNQDTYAALLIVIALTTLLPPFLLRWFYCGPGRQLLSGTSYEPGSIMDADEVAVNPRPARTTNSSGDTRRRRLGFRNLPGPPMYQDRPW